MIPILHLTVQEISLNTETLYVIYPVVRTDTAVLMADYQVILD